MKISSALFKKVRENLGNSIKLSHEAREKIGRIKDEILDNIELKPYSNIYYSSNFDISFKDMGYIDTTSDCFVDLNLNRATTDILDLGHIDHRIYFNNNDITNWLKFGLFYKSKKYFTLKLTPFREANKLTVFIEADSSYAYEVYEIVDNAKKTLATGEIQGRLSLNIKDKFYSELFVRVTFRKTTDFVLKEASLRRPIYKKNGLLKTVLTKIEHDKSTIDVVTKGKNTRTFLGILSDSGDIINFDAKNTIVLDKDSEFKINAVGMSDDFGVPVGVLSKIATVKKTANINSIEVYRGYNRYLKTLITGAFVNEDLSVINFKPSDIVENAYIDIDDVLLELHAGELVTLSHSIECDSDMEIKEPYPVITNELIKTCVLVNGNVCKNNDGFINHELKRGKNEIEIRLYLWKEAEESVYTHTTAPLINLRKYSTLLYVEKMESTLNQGTALDRNNFFCVDSDFNVLCGKTRDDDSFLIVYSKYIKSPFHKVENGKQYLYVIVKVLLEGQDSYVEKIYI